MEKRNNNTMQYTGRRSRILLFTVAICIFHVACKGREPQALSPTQTEIGHVTKEDTLKVEIGQPQILAYSLSQPEYDSLPAEKRDEYDEGYADFSHELGEFSKVDSTLRLRETASEIIIIADTVVARKDLKKYDYGLLLIAKTGSVKIYQGGLTAKELERQSAMLK